MTTVLLDGARMVAYAGFALLAGVSYFVAMCWPEGAPNPAMRRLFWGGWIGVVVATIVTLLFYGSYATGLPFDPGQLDVTLGTRTGQAMIARILMLSLVPAGFVVLLRRIRAASAGERPARLPVVAVLAGATALGTTWTLAGHGGSGMLLALSLPVAVLHMVAMGIWIGGLVVLVGVLLRSGEPQVVVAAVRRFSVTAAVCVCVLVATGTYSSWRQVGISPPALFTTPYGQLLLAKIALVVGIVALGAGSRAWVQRHAQAPAAARSKKDRQRARRGPGTTEIRKLRRFVAFEVGISVAVLGVTASLVSTTPARAQYALDTAPPPTTAAVAPAAAIARSPADGQPPSFIAPYDVGGGEAGRAVVSGMILPGTVGANELHLAVFSPEGMSKDVDAVEVHMSLPERGIGPVPVPLRSIGPGHYASTGMTASAPGRWRLQVTVRATGASDAIVPVDVDIR